MRPITHERDAKAALKHISIDSNELEMRNLLRDNAFRNLASASLCMTPTPSPSGPHDRPTPLDGVRNRIRTSTCTHQAG
jgi:hypothetical protein